MCIALNVSVRNGKATACAVGHVLEKVASHDACELLVLVLCLLTIGCGKLQERSSVLRLASTTSTRDSGLFDVLLPEFEKRYVCRVDLIAVGTGAALQLGEAGDVDVIVCHAPEAEEGFMRAGHGVRREPLMHNFFMIVGF